MNSKIDIKTKILNYINGKFVEPSGGQYLDNMNPAHDKVYSLVPASNAKDVELAVKAAQVAFTTWSKTTATVRANYLKKMADGILHQLEKFAEAESIDSGKTLTLARELEIPRSAKNLNFFADSIIHFEGEIFKTNPTLINRTEFAPLGVVACISPWNLPLYLFTWKIAPALAAGNTVVAKPSELTPMTAFLLAKICDEIGLPPGVLNIIHGLGPDVGAPLVSHANVKAVSFTGSTATGRAIAQAVAGKFKKLSLEMGGKNPNIIFADCDFEKALEMTIKSTFQNQGQICLCGSRIFIENTIYEKFKIALIQKTEKLKIGNPLDPANDQGSLVSKAHLQKVSSYVDLAKTEGGRILTGGGEAAQQGEFTNGYFFQPTLIEGLDFKSRTNQEEIFGPVATLTPFTTEAEVIEMANSTNYGLAATVWTKDLEKAKRISRQLESGLVWVNTWMSRDLRTPFGGVKESGYGREGGFEALKFFSEVKNVCIQYTSEAVL
ncbi:MAG: aldehyde dehydrogenase [Bdellovibrionaceae bacterium]|nr:aldehyde dehydrogenase [Bdellovibrio sp.]